MIGDSLIVDGVVHAVNLDRSNVAEPMRPMTEALLEATYGLHAMLSPESHLLPPERVLRDWSGEELERVLFLESEVDVAVFHSLPLTDFFKDGLVALEKGAEMKRRSPHRVELYAAINPLEGPKALEDIEHAVTDLGALGIKIYPARLLNGRTVPIRLDDPEYGIPVIERAIELGVRCIAVHKYFPVGPTNLSAYNVDDVEIAGRYPEINFEVLHPGFAFTDETTWLLLRYPNVYVNLEWTISLVFRAPRRFAEVLGTLLSTGAEERIFWASGASIVHPQPVLEAFLDFQMPDDLITGYGFPPLTDEAKRKILGENWCRMHGLDPQALLESIATDKWSARRADGTADAWSTLDTEPALGGGIR